MDKDSSLGPFEQCSLSSCDVPELLRCNEVIGTDSQDDDKALEVELDFFSENSKFKRKRGEDNSPAEKRRKSCILRTASDSIPTCVKVSQKSETKSHKKECALVVENLEIPESSSLFFPFSVTWTLKSPTKEFDLSKSYFTYIPNPNSKNGIWLKLNTTLRQREIFLFIELYEKRLNDKDSTDKLVEFCKNGVCSKKRRDVVEFRGKRLDAQSGETDDICKFEGTFAINEQCAHRSDNDYGSPNTRFYFKFQLCEKIVEPNKIAKTILLSQCTSSLIKVVAPGKNKDPSQKLVSFSKKGTKSKKVTVKQMLETILRRMQHFEERLQFLESRIEEQQKQQALFPFPLGQLDDPGLQLKFSGNLDVASVLATSSDHAVKQELLNERSCEESMQCLSKFLNLSQ